MGIKKKHLAWLTLGCRCCLTCIWIAYRQVYQYEPKAPSSWLECISPDMLIYSPLDVDDLPYHTGQRCEGMRNGCCINILFLWQSDQSVFCCPLCFHWKGCVHKVVSVTTDIHCAFLKKNFWRQNVYVCKEVMHHIFCLAQFSFKSCCYIYCYMIKANKPTKGVIMVFWIWKQFKKLWILNQIKVVYITRQSLLEFSLVATF